MFNINLNWKNITTRAAWSFLQGVVAAAALVSVAPTTLDGWKDMGFVVLGGGVTSLVSFIKTVITEIVTPTVTLKAAQVGAVYEDAVVSAPPSTPIV